MKPSTLNSLIVARSLFEDARIRCNSDDRHSATAGLILLQDAFELVMLAILLEKGVDETKSIESNTFDQLIGELKAISLQVPKSGALKAMNKHRVLAKHYGQIADPFTVRGYLDAVTAAVDFLLIQVIGRPFNQIYLTNMLDAGQARDFLDGAAALIESEQFLQALIEIRKALFVSIEKDYSLFEYRERLEGGPLLGLALFTAGWKAPSYMKNKKWIDENVNVPTDYIQIDHERLRLEAMEWGVNTAELQNLRRLTPLVFQAHPLTAWCVLYGQHFPVNEANAHNAQYCLDRTIAVIQKKQAHSRTDRWPQRDKYAPPPNVYVGDSLFAKASVQSAALHTISADYGYTMLNLVTGFDGSTNFLHVSAASTAVDERGHSRQGFIGYIVERPQQQGG